MLPIYRLGVIQISSYYSTQSWQTPSFEFHTSAVATGPSEEKKKDKEKDAEEDSKAKPKGNEEDEVEEVGDEDEEEEEEEEDQETKHEDVQAASIKPLKSRSN